MKYYITPIAKLARYNIKIIFGNKFMYFILSAVGFYILTVGLNLISDYDGYRIQYVISAFYPIDLLSDLFRYTERPGCQNHRNHFRYSELSV